jgi:hypothetical protein
MPLIGIRAMSANELRAAVDAFAPEYVNDWDWWLSAPAARRPVVMGKILRRWQATRPQPMRRAMSEAEHSPPYLDDLLADAAQSVRALAGLDVARVAHRSPEQDAALRSLWDDFSRLTATGSASCVGITKAVMLATDGGFGPALDSQVRGRLSLGKPLSSTEWIRALEGAADDIAAFESRQGPVASAVSERFGHLRIGRLYDMALGPRRVAISG